MSDRYDGKKLSDLGLSAERVKELQEYAQGLGSDHGDYGYSAKTEHHFKETDNPTSEGSIQADMRKIGEHLGYKHAGTLNHDKVKSFILEGEGPKAEAEEEPKKYEPSDKIKTAVERVENFEKNDYNIYKPGNGSKTSQEYLDQYKMNLREKVASKKAVATSIAEVKEQKVDKQM